MREEFLHALRRAEIMTARRPTRQAHFAKTTCHHRQLSEVGEARESLAVNYKGKELAVAFNPKYLIDPLMPCRTTKSIWN